MATINLKKAPEKRDWGTPQIITSIGTPLFDARLFVDTIVHVDSSKDVCVIDLILYENGRPITDADVVKYRMHFYGTDCWRQMEYWLKEVPIMTSPVTFTKYDTIHKKSEPPLISIQMEMNVIISFFLQEISVLEKEVVAWREKLREQKELGDEK